MASDEIKIARYTVPGVGSWDVGLPEDLVVVQTKEGPKITGVSHSRAWRAALAAAGDPLNQCTVKNCFNIAEGLEFCKPCRLKAGRP